MFIISVTISWTTPRNNALAIKVEEFSVSFSHDMWIWIYRTYLQCSFKKFRLLSDNVLHHVIYYFCRLLLKKAGNIGASINLWSGKTILCWCQNLILKQTNVCLSRNRSAIVHFHAIRCMNLTVNTLLEEFLSNEFGSLDILKNTFHLFHFWLIVTTVPTV